MSLQRLIRPRLWTLCAALLAALVVPSGSTVAATPDDGLGTYREALSTMRADPQSGRLSAEIGSYDAWLRAAAAHAAYGQTEALERTRTRLDAQRELIEARLALLRTRAEADRARDTLRALDNRIQDARAERALLERHQERTHKRGQ